MSKKITKSSKSKKKTVATRTAVNPVNKACIAVGSCASKLPPRKR